MTAGTARFARNRGCRNRAGPAYQAENCFSPAYRAENCERTVFILKIFTCLPVIFAVMV